MMLLGAVLLGRQPPQEELFPVQPGDLDALPGPYGPDPIVFGPPRVKNVPEELP